MGRDKAFQPIEGTSLLETAINRLSALQLPLLVVTSVQQYGRIANLCNDHPVMIDRYPGMSVMGAIYTALTGSQTNCVFITGCDMPFLDIDLIRYQITLTPGYSAVVPRINGMTEPLHSIYTRDCLGAISLLLRKNILRISELFNLVNTRYVEVDEIDRYDPLHSSFININTKEDLDNVRAISCRCNLTQSAAGVSVCCSH